MTIAVLRPLQMLLTEPIVAMICLYVACMFATLFTFFAAVPYVFVSGAAYHFSLEQAGLVFLSVVVGCVLGTITIILCDVFLYRRQISRHPPHQVPPEHRLYPAMIGSVGLPLGLFWFAWTARSDISWASPVVAIVPFAWGNLCLFVSTAQFIGDTYMGSVVASAMSANSLARYGLAGAFPLFTLQSKSVVSSWGVRLRHHLAACNLEGQSMSHENFTVLDTNIAPYSVLQAWNWMGKQSPRLSRPGIDASSMDFLQVWEKYQSYEQI
jgi:hypothetical protein